MTLPTRTNTQRNKARQSLLRVLCAVGLLLGSQCMALAQGTPTPAPQLPPFRADPTLPSNIVLNPEQGLGLCHWLDAQILSNPLVSWAYDATQASSGWSTVEPQNGSFDWTPLDGRVAKAQGLGRRVWIELLTTEGLAPQWAQSAGVTLVGSRGGTPVPWNEAYLRLLRRAVHAMAERYDEDPTVDAVNIMAGGCYGEMTICASNTDTKAWEQAGYTDEKFIAAVKKIIDIYLEDDYQWEDGSHSHGFRKTPVVLQLGAGLYGHTAAVIQPVVDYAMSTYGMRVWLKYNGYGGGHDMGWLFRQYESVTRVGYEPAGNNQDFLNQPKQFVQTALEQHVSYLCLQDVYFNVASLPWQEAREAAARYLGTQIVNLEANAPSTLKAGQEFLFTTSWVNRGTVPLMRPERQGQRDVPASYDIQVSLVDTASGNAVFEHSFTPSVPTQNWYSAQPVNVDSSIALPTYVPSGDYDLRVALVNPNLPADEPTRRFHLVNAGAHDGNGRYTVGRVSVLNEVVPTPTATSSPSPQSTPTPTPVPPVQESGPAQWLRAILEWLKRLFRVFE